MNPRFSEKWKQFGSVFSIFLDKFVQHNLKLGKSIPQLSLLLDKFIQQMQKDQFALSNCTAQKHIEKSFAIGQIYPARF